MGEQAFTPGSAAILLTHWLDALEASGAQRFPVDVKELALHVGQQLKWSDEIFEVRAANIDSFEGGLFQIEGRGWALLYNEQFGSAGRVRFTQAHELGHYLLHREVQGTFQCTQGDMVQRSPDQAPLEFEANTFASHLLMPMKQFRACTAGAAIDFDQLSDAANKFGVSLTAAALRWVQSTEESAMLVMARDGYMLWSVSSEKARDNGAFFPTRGRTVAVPPESIAASATKGTRGGEHVPLAAWFEHAHKDAVAREMKLACESFGYTLSLLHLSAGDKVWEPRAWGSG